MIERKIVEERKIKGKVDDILNEYGVWADDMWRIVLECGHVVINTPPFNRTPHIGDLRICSQCSREE